MALACSLTLILWFSLQLVGGKANHHPGNKLYRKLVGDMKQSYLNTEDKDDKTDMSRRLVDKICSYGGRFIKMDANTRQLYVLTKAEARMKCAQALRENRNSKCSEASDFKESKATIKKNSCVQDYIGSIPATNTIESASLECVVALVSLIRSSSCSPDSITTAATGSF